MLTYVLTYVSYVNKMQPAVQKGVLSPDPDDLVLVVTLL